MCGNWLCSDAGRKIGRIRAIAYSSGPLRDVIHRYKYQDRTGWSLIFGRLLVAWLEANAATSTPDLIVANPTYRGPDGAAWGHTEAVLEAARREDLWGRWPFALDPPLLAKLRPTQRSAGAMAPVKRAAGAELRAALHLVDPRRTSGRHVLVYDDVCTTGSQLNAVADLLVTEGRAAWVEAIVLARQPWQPPKGSGGAPSGAPGC